MVMLYEVGFEFLDFQGKPQKVWGIDKFKGQDVYITNDRDKDDDRVYGAILTEEDMQKYINEQEDIIVYLNKQEEDRLKAEKEYKEQPSRIEQDILNKVKVFNEDREMESGTTTSIILYIMKELGMQIPLKTQGWIKSALAYIWYDEEKQKYTYSYYSDHKNSTSFQKYLDELILKLKEKYGLDTSDEQKKIDAENDKQIQIDKIPSVSINKEYNFRDRADMTMLIRKSEKHIFTNEEKEFISQIMFKNLKDKNPVDAAKSKMWNEQLFGKDNKTSIYYGKNSSFNISCSAYENNGEVWLLFTKNNNKTQYCKVTMNELTA